MSQEHNLGHELMAQNEEKQQPKQPDTPMTCRVDGCNRPFYMRYCAKCDEHYCVGCEHMKSDCSCK